MGQWRDSGSRHLETALRAQIRPVCDFLSESGKKGGATSTKRAARHRRHVGEVRRSRSRGFAARDLTRDRPASWQVRSHVSPQSFANYDRSLIVRTSIVVIPISRQVP